MDLDSGTRPALSLREASTIFGVSVQTLRRRIRDDELPEAVLDDGVHGEEYRIPFAAIGAVADREGWTVDVTDTDAPPAGVAPQDDVQANLLERLLEAQRVSAEADAKSELNERLLQQARSDLENEQAERQRLETDLSNTNTELTDSQRSLAVADAQVIEIRKNVELLETSVQQGLEALETAKTETEVARLEAEETATRELELAERLAEVEAAKLSAEASLGWLGKRRLAKRKNG